MPPKFPNINFPMGEVGEKKRAGPGRPAGGFVVFHLFSSKGFGIALGLTGRAGGCVADYLAGWRAGQLDDWLTDSLAG